ncbi:MAG: TraB/GumN family protein [Candidatus Diapherotrites archaeon]|nr:TraB/GumN family protein [Candidatus Diapherotrites archaeon]
MVVKKIDLKDKIVVLVGTAHVSNESIKEVKETIIEEKPDCIALELDYARFAQLSEEHKWKKTDVLTVIKQGKAYLLLFNLILSGMQRRIGRELGIKPGSEMLEAAKIAKEHNIRLAFVDRDIEITMRRTFATMSFFEKLRLFFELFLYIFGVGERLTPEKVEELKKDDVLSAVIKELSKQFPSIKKVIVDERDQYIAASISAIKAKKIVAVVGAGHMKGIAENLGKEIDLNTLKKAPKKHNYGSIIGFLMLGILILMLSFGFYFKGPQFVLSAFVVWFLINSSLSAIGAIIVKAHWKSVLAAFLAAPFTTLHPALASGWFAGAVEAKIRPPLVEDLESIQKIESVMELNRNRFTHILVVTAAVNLASSIATFISLAIIASML